MMMETPMKMMDDLQTEPQSKEAGSDLEETKTHQTHALTETTLMAGTRMILTIPLSVSQTEEMVMRLDQKGEMMETQSMMMDETMIVQVLKLAGCEEVDQRHQLTPESSEQQDTIRTIHSTLRTEFLNVEMDWKHQKKHEMMVIQTMEMDATMTAHQLKIVGYAEMDHLH